MSSRGPKSEPEPCSVPSWVVSFGDMITNLLACFVMMQAFATTQDKTLFNAGMGSYRRAVSQYGLPDYLFGKEDKVEFDYRKIKYPTPNDDRDDNTDDARIIDRQEDQIRRAFAKMNEAMETSGNEVGRKLLGLRRLDVKYRPGEAEVDASGREALSRLTAQLRQGLARRKVKICVIGVVSRFGTQKQQWVLSAKRARWVERHIRTELASYVRQGRLELVSWGAGEGRRWCRKAGLDKPADCVILATIGNGEDRG